MRIAAFSLILLILAFLFLIFSRIKVAVYSIDKPGFLVIELVVWELKIYRLVLYIRAEKFRLKIVRVKKHGKQDIFDSRKLLRKKAVPEKPIQKKQTKQKINVKKLLTAIYVEKFAADVALGLGDAAACALVVGTLRTLIGCLIIGRKEYQISIEPIFGKNVVLLKINCIFYTTIVDIIYSLLRRKP